jgi:hypothetical protein
MPRLLLALAFATGLAGAAAAFTLRPTLVYPHMPAKPFESLGEVSVASQDRPTGVAWSAHHAAPLAAAARARYGRDARAIIGVRHEPLPNGSGARSSGTAVAWSKKPP